MTPGARSKEMWNGVKIGLAVEKARGQTSPCKDFRDGNDTQVADGRTLEKYRHAEFLKWPLCIKISNQHRRVLN
jgi:hypothetical protein